MRSECQKPIVEENLKLSSNSQRSRNMAKMTLIPVSLCSRDDCQSYLNTILAGQRIHFATASAKFKEESYDVLTKLAHTAGRCSDTRIEIQGHTDSDGSRKFNEFLSLRRARSVVKYLIENGISKDRLSAIGYGEAKPVAPNDNDDNKAKNRRIEFKVKEF